MESSSPSRAGSAMSHVPYGEKKKFLLIFDLNKVLVCRRGKSKSFKVRPHAVAFIKGMAQWYHLAVWTSCGEATGNPIVKHLFNGTELLFVWYNARCHRVKIPSSFSSLASSSHTNVGTDNPRKDAEISDDEDICAQFAMQKPLSAVWEAYPQFCSESTILLDDSVEKCLKNPPHTYVNPQPFNVDFGAEQRKVEQMRPKKMNKKGRKRKLAELATEAEATTAVTSTAAIASIVESATTVAGAGAVTGASSAEEGGTGDDTELFPGGALWRYLEHIACQGETTILSTIVAERGKYQASVPAPAAAGYYQPSTATVAAAEAPC